MRAEGDVLIVGGGISGLALSLRLGAAGHSVLVVDKAPLPRDKVCGEGLMPMAMDALPEFGLEPGLLPGSDFCGLEYRSRRQRAILSFREGQRGRGVRRTVLIAALAERSRQLSTVTHHSDLIREPLWEKGRVVGARGTRRVYRARVVVAADGVHSRMAKAAGMQVRPLGYRMALRRHYRPRGELEMARVCVGLFSPHDVYLTPVDGETFLATTMTNRAGYRAAVGDYDGFLRRSPFAERFVDCAPATALLGWFHPLFVPDRYHIGGMLLAGDAGGGVDPCLGVGISLALASASMAADTVEGILAEPERRLAWEIQFDRQRRILFQHFSAFGRVFRLAIRSRAGGEVLLWAMRHWPGVAENLLDIVATGHSWKTFSWPALLEPLLGGGGRGRQAGAGSSDCDEFHTQFGSGSNERQKE